jgi:hypothetical protein
MLPRASLLFVTVQSPQQVRLRAMALGCGLASLGLQLGDGLPQPIEPMLQHE